MLVKLRLLVLEKVLNDTGVPRRPPGECSAALAAMPDCASLRSRCLCSVLAFARLFQFW